MVDVDKSKMRGDNGVMRTQSLFLEESYGDQSAVCYTLSPFDKGKIPSIYQLYVDFGDPDEFTFANTYFLGMDHWRKICEAPFFAPHLEKMRADLRLKIKSEALYRIRKEAEDPESKNYFAALKYLSDGGYEEKAKKGRPSKAAVAAEAKKQAAVKSELDEILSRMEVSPQTSKEMN